MKDDLYDDFHPRLQGRGIQACVSFGVLEHFRFDDISGLIDKQLKVAPLMIFMVPVRTPKTLKTFRAELNPEGHIDQNGIYRNFWTPEFWENEVLGGRRVIDRARFTETRSDGQIDTATFVVVKG